MMAVKRSRLFLASALIALPMILAGACGGSDGEPAANKPSNEKSSGAAFPERTITAGEVTVKIRPERIDAEGAVFKVAFDTHSDELDLDVAGASRLVVGEQSWDGARWEGDPPGGHHREGRLIFPSAGAPKGRARLAIEGLPAPVEATWDVTG